MLDRKKGKNTVCCSINSLSNLVNNVFASVHYVGFNKKLLFFLTKNFRSFPDFVQKGSEHCWGIFLPGGENLRRIDFDDSEIFQSWKEHFANTEHQLKSKLA